jgi:hypothetical protein
MTYREIVDVVGGEKSVTLAALQYVYGQAKMSQDIPKGQRVLGFREPQPNDTYLTVHEEVVKFRPGFNVTNGFPRLIVEPIPTPKSYKLVPVVGEDGNQLTLPTRVGQYVKYSNGCLAPITRRPLLWSEPGDLVFDLVEVTD